MKRFVTQNTCATLATKKRSLNVHVLKFRTDSSLKFASVEPNPAVQAAVINREFLLFLSLSIGAIILCLKIRNGQTLLLCCANHTSCNTSTVKKSCNENCCMNSVQT